MKKNGSFLRFGLGEWTGSLGDLGTFLPIYLSLVTLNGLDPARSLFLAGLVYVVTSYYFRVPVPVQPLKAMAAIAIAQGLEIQVLSAAGIWMGLILLLLAKTRLIGKIEKYFSPPIVKGIQLGVGFMLIKAGAKLIFASDTVYSRSFPSAMLIPGADDFILAFWLLVLPQIPLTLGNAVFAASDVAHNYFGPRAEKVTPHRLTLSLGLANLGIGFLGGLPVCHGSGGLTAHVRFGARTSGSTVLTGTLFIVMAFLFSDGVHNVFGLIPSWLLGAMVLYVGWCHAHLFFILREKRVLAFSMGLLGLVTGNLAFSLIFGLLWERIDNASLFLRKINEERLSR